MSLQLTTPGLNSYFQQFRDLKIAVIGDLMLDQYLQGSVKRISPEAPIPVVRIESDTAHPGGAANVAWNLIRLGATCSLVGVCGEDAQRARLFSCLRTHGLETRGVVADPAATTIVKTRVMSRQQQLLRIDHEAPPAGQNARAAAALEKRLIARARQAIAGVDAVVLSDYVKGCLTPGLIRAALQMARRQGIPVLVDSKDNDVAKFQGATWIKPNRNEAARVVGFDLVSDADFVKAARIFVARTDCKVVAITRSSKGMSIFERVSGNAGGKAGGKKGGGRAAIKLRRLDSPTHALEVFDVTGGGDTALSVMALMAAVNAPLEDTIELANLASGVTVLHVGTYAPTPADIMALYAQHTVSNEAGKLVPAGQALALIKPLQAAGKKVVFTNGCFDIFHAGHVQTLQHARSLGDVLIVGINSDASVRRQGKGADRPLVDEFARAMVLSSLGCVDYVIIYDEDTPIPLLKKLKPDVLVKGGDYGKKQVVGWQLVEAYGGKVVVAPLVDGLSTTRLVAKIRGAETPPT